MDFKDYYKTLGLARTATQDEIKRAYRKLVRKHHPDANVGSAGSEAMFKEVGEAYSVLGDEEKRTAYDQLGSDWQAGQSFRPPPDWQGRGAQDPGDAQAFSDFFETLFTRRGGGGGAREFHAQGQDQHARIEIALRDAYEGATHEVTMRMPEVDAAGRMVLRDRTLRVRIPKGVTEGQHIRLPGKGAPGYGEGRPGDLYLEVTLRPDPVFSVEGRDVFFDVPVTPWEAALGGRIAVETPSGSVELSIPAHAQSGKKLRLKGRGIPGDPPGDLYAVLRIVVPPRDTEAMRDLYRQMAKLSDFDPRKTMGG